MTAAELPVMAIDTPVMYEDEGQENMGDSWVHTTTEAILRFGLIAHFARRNTPATVIPNMNLYYHPVDRWAYVSPDVMVLPVNDLPKSIRSYRVGKTGPAPFLVVEVLSERTFQQGDLTLKPKIYHDLGVLEYLLVDVTGEFMPQRLILKSAAGEGWINQPDQGRGVVSSFGFRVIIEGDEEVRVIDETSGHHYPRPDEILEQAENLDAAQQQIRDLKAEIARLKGQPPSTNGH